MKKIRKYNKMLVVNVRKHKRALEKRLLKIAGSYSFGFIDNSEMTIWR